MMKGGGYVEENPKKLARKLAVYIKIKLLVTKQKKKYRGQGK